MQTWVWGDVIVPAMLRIRHRLALHHGLALRQAVHRHPHASALQREQFRVCQHHKCQHIVTIAPDQLTNQRVVPAIKGAVKPNCVQQGVGGMVSMPRRDLLEQLQRHDHLVRHVQPDHGEIPARCEHPVGSVRVIPDIGLGHR
jgi:hypothetical protein